MTEAIGYLLSHKRLHGVERAVVGSTEEPVPRIRQGLDTSVTPSSLSGAPSVLGPFLPGF